MATTLASKRRLFDEDSEGGESDGGAELKINEHYAKRFEHNKKREELQRLEQKYGSATGHGAEGDDDDGTSSSDETEDEDGFLVTEDLDAEITATLQAIKNKDPRIYDKNAIFYKPIGTGNGETEAEKSEREKPVTIREYQQEKYNRVLAGEEEEEEDTGPVPQRTFAQAQLELKDNILSEIKAAVNGQDDDEDDDQAFVKAKNSAPHLTNGVRPSPTPAIRLTEIDVEKADKDPDDFLNKFMASKAWVDEGHDWKPFDSDEEGVDTNDLAEEFEQAYNMRFEDPEKSNEVLKSYSRNLAASRSVRQNDVTGRQRRRQLEKERKEEGKRQRQEERARYRRLKIEEAAEKLEKIKKAAGLSGKSLLNDQEWIKLLDDAWDNDQWEEDMQKKFGDAYYAEKDDLTDADEVFDIQEASAGKSRRPKKPKWDDDVDIKDLVPDYEDGLNPGITLTDSEEVDEVDLPIRKRPAEYESDDDDEDAQHSSKRRKSGKEQRKDRAESKRQKRKELAQIETLVDVKMNLDEPSILSDRTAIISAGPDSQQGARAAPATTPFRYRETSPTTFGLTARDILLAPSDAALNQFSGLKHIAPYRDAEKKRKDKKRLGKKARLREWRRETFGDDFEHTGPTYGFAEVQADDGKDVDGALDLSAVTTEKKKRKRVKKKRSRGKTKKAQEIRSMSDG
jgi:protein KRI1